EVAAAEVAAAVGCGGFGEWRRGGYEIGRWGAYLGSPEKARRKSFSAAAGGGGWPAAGKGEEDEVLCVFVNK
nr:hypothetical protein [Tanacetum cinerariifolium]